jgi:hypothetical protein
VADAEGAIHHRRGSASSNSASRGQSPVADHKTAMQAERCVHVFIDWVRTRLCSLRAVLCSTDELTVL